MTITTHEEAERALRASLPGIVDLKIFTYQHNNMSGRRSHDVPPEPRVRGWSCTVPRLGKNGAVVAGAWKLPTTADKIAADARSEVEKAIRLRDREMVHEKDFEEQLAADDEAQNGPVETATFAHR